MSSWGYASVDENLHHLTHIILPLFLGVFVYEVMVYIINSMGGNIVVAKKMHQCSYESEHGMNTAPGQSDGSGLLETRYMDLLQGHNLMVRYS